jgi:hypothetical protein
LLRATSDPAERPGFLRALMDAQVFIVLVSESGPIAPDADGNVTIPEGTVLRMATASRDTASRDDEMIVPFFSAPSRARAWYEGEHFIVSETPRELFGRVPDASFVLNPGTAGKEFTRDEVARLLAGDFDEGGLRTVTLDKSTTVLLAQPADYPTDITSRLSSLFESVPEISAAFLAQISYPGEPPHLLIAIDAAIEWRALMDRIRPQLNAALPPDRPIDLTPLSSFEHHFQSVAPFFVRNRSR